MTILYSLIYLILFCHCNLNIDAKVISAYVMPHGGIALDPRYFNSTNATSIREAWELHNATVLVGEEISRQSPDIIVLSTPHGMADLTRWVLYLNTNAGGTADTDNCKCPPCCYNVSAQLDTDLSMSLALELSKKHDLSGLTAFGAPGTATSAFPLRWGEVIPLHFIPDLASSRVVLLSQPSRRYDHAVEMIPELLDLGRGLLIELDKLDDKVVVIISGDLAHTHDASGPYGYSPAADPFDKACGRWVQTGEGSELTKVAASLVDKALSCGYTGFVMLQGMIESSSGPSSWKRQLHTNHHPSYYGMMVSSWTRVNFTLPSNDTDSLHGALVRGIICAAAGVFSFLNAWIF